MVLPIRYLHVTLSLPNDDHQCQTFALYMQELLPLFCQRPWPGWDLVLSARHTPGRDSAGYADDTNVQNYLHLWRVRDYNSLPYIMEIFDDNEIYKNLDAMVRKEVQDFFQSLSYNPQSEDPNFLIPQGARFFLKCTFNVVADPDALTAFDFFMTQCANDTASPLHAKFGWTLINAAYSQTGLLRRYTLIWSTSSALPDPEGTVVWLLAQPQVKGALNQEGPGNPQWDLWEPVSYCG
jgi:hypothetical protein